MPRRLRKRILCSLAAKKVSRSSVISARLKMPVWLLRSSWRMSTAITAGRSSGTAPPPPMTGPTRPRSSRRPICPFSARQRVPMSGVAEPRSRTAFSEKVRQLFGDRAGVVARVGRRLLVGSLVLLVDHLISLRRGSGTGV